ncbi:MAG TPA: hypothetical protein VN654_21040 [Vicinamibacterales bacterium]|jgi:hypothetical protein|nr:hypothetical protein [Vicinamibacterales bacterium]
MSKAFIFVAALLAATAAYAQNAPAPANGPLVLERIHDGWVLAPDFKVTDVDDRTGELAGVYGGRLIDNTLLIGGAGYWLTNDARDFKMTYGGVIVGWQSREFGRIRFGGRGLAGGGTATLGFDVTSLRAGPVFLNVPRAPGDIRFGVVDPRTPVRPAAPAQPQVVRSLNVLAHEDFFVVEPQASISARLTKGIGVSCGVGYRETAYAAVLRDRLNGPTANLAIQFGW